MPLSVDSVSPLNEHYSCAPASFPVPPHLMGRNIHNPANDPDCSGRRLQKPRFGVRIPYRNLTSQIVTQEEIAQEILHRSMKKNASSQSPSTATENTRTSGESIFAMRLSRHLANRLSSPNKDVDVICNKSSPDVRAKVQAELKSSIVKPEGNNHGSPGMINQPTKELQRVSARDASAATLPVSSLHSPRISLNVIKLDKEVEREMALKQLKELPMIKGRTGELTGDLPLSRSSRRSLNYSTCVSSPSSSNTKDVENEDNILSFNADNCVTECTQGNLIVQLHKLDDIVSKSEDQVVSNPVESNSPSNLFTSKCSDTKHVEKITQCRYAKTDKVFPKDAKLRINKTFKSKLTNGHSITKMKEMRKRRSMRLNIVHARKEVNSLISNGNLNATKKKRGKKKNGNLKHPVAANVKGSTVFEVTGNKSSENIQDSLVVTSQSTSGCKSLPNVKSEKNSALEDVTDAEVYSSEKGKERKVSEGENKTFKNDSDEGRKSKRLRELDNLLMDEGALNMILETSPLVADIVTSRRTKYPNKNMRAFNQESITLRKKLAKKHVLHDIKSSSKPKLRLIKEKVKEPIEVIDITTPKKLSPSKVTTPISQNITSVRRYSSSDSSPVCAKSSPATKSSESDIFDKNSVQKNTPSKLEIPGKKVPFVNLECIEVAQMKTPLISNKHDNLSRLSGVRKAFTVPKMSNSVRMKLNSEMSKNFLKGLNLESTKFVPLKTVKTKKSSDTPLKTTSIPNQVKAVVSLKDIEEIKSPVSENRSVSSDNLKPLSILNGKELSICVTKLKDESEVSYASIHDTKTNKLSYTHAIPEALPAPNFVLESSPPRLPMATAKVSSKVKKSKDLNAMSFKHLIDKEHRIVSIPLSPIASSYNNITKGLKNLSQKHKKKSSKLEKQMELKECLRQRFSGRQNAGTFSYKEICLRRYENFVQIILAPCSTVMKNSLNVQVLHEFQDALLQLRRDRFCRVVLVTSTGSTFCQGVDLHSLIHVNIEHRKKAAEQLSKALKEFLKTLAMFNKPIVAGVHGASVGLGVTMLPFFDVVFASDKATFYTPYARLGQVPEGAAVLTLPLLLGNAVTSELLFGSRRLTATEAVQHGLVTRVLWPDKFQEELIPNVEAIANQSSQAMESMKALLRLNLRVKLDATLDSESSLLVQHWCSPECQRNFRKFLDMSDDVLFQRQKKDRS